MNESNIKYLESKLGIKLPDFYVKTMLNYPFPNDSWGAEFSLCNDVKSVIEINNIFELKDSIFAFGTDGGEFIYYIKLNGEEKVYIYDLEGSKFHDSIEANNWKEYLEKIELQEEEIARDLDQEQIRKQNKKWWQFWI